MRRLNVRLFLILVCGTVVLVTGLFVIHWLQKGSISRALLARADRAADQQHLEQVARYVSRYLELQPDDVEQRARLGMVLASESVAVTPRARSRAVFVIEQVLRKEPERHELRLKLARLALELDKPELAREHLQVLLAAQPDSGPVEHLLAQAAATDKKWDEAAGWYRKAIQHGPQQLDSYVFLADLLRRRFGPDAEVKHAAEADGVMDRLTAANPDNFQAQLARWRYRKLWTSPEEARKTAGDNVRAALRLAPDHAETLLAAAELAQLDKDPAQALQHLEKARQLHPHDPRPYRELAVLELRQDRRERAVACLRDGARALSGAGQIELLWTLANVLIDGGEIPEAKAVVAQMIKDGASAPSLDYLNARLHIQQGNWAEAAKLLERTRPMLSAVPELSTQVDLLLARCFEQLDDPAAQLAALGRVITRDHTSVPGRLGMAAGLASAGRIDEALQQYRDLMNQPGAPATGWIEIARLLVQRELQRDAQSPDRRPKRAAGWKEAEAALDNAEKANPGAVEVVLLRAEVLLAQEKADAARQLLTAARDKQKDRIALWAALAALTAEGGTEADVAAAAQLLDEAKTHTGDTLDWRMAQARFWARQKGPRVEPALAQLAQGVDRFKARERSRLLSEVAVAYYRAGKPQEAARLWDRLAQEPENKNDLRLRLLQFDLALLAGDDKATARLLGELRQIEGEQGTLWRYAAAVRAIGQARAGKPANLEDARALLDAVAARRPEWPNVLVAKAELEELNSNPDQAVAHYRRAISLGERSPKVVRQLVQLLCQQQRYEDADREMQHLQKLLPGSSDVQGLQRLAVDISLQNQDAERAVKLAMNAVAADSRDYRDHLWQGQVLAASGIQDDKAEKELRKAIELNDTAPETWLALVRFLARKNRTADAEKAIAVATPKLPADKAPLALGQCCEMVGRRDDAEKHYRTALEAKPADVAVLRNVAAFYLRTGRVALAEPLLRKFLDGEVPVSAAEKTWARHSLALTLATRGDHTQLPKALTLVGLRIDAAGAITEAPAQHGDDRLEEQRVRAQVLAFQPWRGPRQKAIALLEDLSTKRALAPDDQFLLAQLYEADDAWPKARDLLRLLTGPAKNAYYLNYYAQALLRRGDLNEVERCIGRLEVLERTRRLDAGTLASVELKARLLEARGQGEKALTLLREQVGKAGSKPEQAFLLINGLARQRRYTEALGLCEKVRADCPPELVAGTTVALLRSAQSGDDACTSAERWLKEQCDKDPKSARLWLALANLYDLRGRYAEAETVCRKVLELDDRHLLALNNLAWLLAQKPDKTAEALVLINRAIEMGGPRAEFLDTRATVHLALKRSDLAIADLEAASADSADPARYFHLAQAQRMANNAKEAHALLKKATSAGLKAEHLHPVERIAFLKMVSELEQR